jgi:hypothetical protein
LTLKAGQYDASSGKIATSQKNISANPSSLTLAAAVDQALDH